MTSPKWIAAGWAQYVERVLPANASSVQRSETRRAFYAGADVLFMSIMAGLDPEKEPTDADMARMAAIEAGLMEFAADVAAGRA